MYVYQYGALVSPCGEKTVKEESHSMHACPYIISTCHAQSITLSYKNYLTILGPKV